MNWILALLLPPPASYVPAIAVEAAYQRAAPQAVSTVVNPPAPLTGCPGGCKCDNGLVQHGDGHRTRCKCQGTSCPCQKGF
jgi:hypothetical protein